MTAKKSDFYTKKSKVDGGYIGFYKPCPSLSFWAKTKEEALKGIEEAAKKKEESRESLRQFAEMQEEAWKDVPRLLKQLKKIEESFKKKRERINKYNYKISWSDKDNEYIGSCEKYPSLSWLAETPDAALKGIIKLVNDVEKDIENESKEQSKKDSLYKTSEEWQKLCTMEVYDPDGWDRQGDFHYSWYEEKITREEFEHRLFQSTCKYTKEYTEIGIWRDKPNVDNH